MGGQPSIYLACACAALAHFFAIGGGAHAQETDGQVLIAGGISPVSVTHTTISMDGERDRSTTFAQSGLGGQTRLAVGFGLGPWVLALETAFTYSVARDEQDGPSFNALETFVTKRTEIMFGPSARFLFVEGAVRPYVETGAGFGVLRVDAEGNADDGVTLYVRGGPGLQLRLADAVSLDLTLRVGYAATTGEAERYSVLSRPVNTTTGLYEPYATVSVEYDVRQIAADVAARISIWL